MSTETKVPETLEEAQDLLNTEREKSKKFEDRAIGAEKVIENHKKKDPEPKPKPNDDPKPQFWAEDMKKMLDEIEFYKANPDMVEYKDKLAEYTSKWISLNDAKALLERNDETIANRKNAKKIDFTTWTPWVAAKTMTQEDLSKLKWAEFKRAIEMRNSGELKII